MREQTFAVAVSLRARCDRDILDQKIIAIRHGLDQRHQLTARMKQVEAMPLDRFRVIDPHRQWFTADHRDPFCIGFPGQRPDCLGVLREPQPQGDHISHSDVR
jgi:hypothetical protein